MKCRPYGKRKRNERSIVNYQSLIGKKHSFGNRGNKQYVKCGFCSNFYLKGTLSHSCFLKPTDSNFGNVSRQSTAITSHNVFYYSGF